MQRAIINISVPQAIAKQITKTAKEENKTKSELMREAFRVYKRKSDWARFRLLGEETAIRMNIKTYDDVERIAG